MLRRPILILTTVTAPLLMAWTGGAAGLNHAATLNPIAVTSLDEDEDEQLTPLQDGMLSLKSGSRAMRGLLARGDGPATLVVVGDMQSALIICKSAMPPAAEAMDEEARAAFVKRYRETMLTLLENLIALERHVLDGETESALSIYNESIKPLELMGHSEFRDVE